MTKKQYEEKRKALMDEAERLIENNQADEAEAKIAEVTALDNQWDSIAKAQANYNALNKEPAAAHAFEVKDALDKNEKVLDTWKSDTYKNAWAKTMMGKKLTADESQAFLIVNDAYTHTTGNTSIVIPDTVAKGIWEIAGEMYPYFNDVTKTYVNGVFSIIKEDSSTDSGWYEEDDITEDGKETFETFSLSGCELSRNITVSWKLKEMAIEDFIPYIQRKMAKKMGKGAGYGVTHGIGSKAVEGKPEPMGTVTALEAEAGMPQVVEYANGTIPTYNDILNARARIKSGYGAGLKIYANSNTIWTKIAAIVDKNGRPLFIPDTTSAGKNRVLGMEVKEDDSMEDGEILFSNPTEGYHMNINKETTITTEDRAKRRTTDYCGYAIMDGNVTTNKAHALLKEAAAG